MNDTTFRTALESFTPALWPVASCPISYKHLSPRALISLGFAVSGPRKLRCIGCGQEAMLDEDLVVGGVVPACYGENDLMKDKIERFIWRLRNSTHDPDCRYRIVAESEKALRPDFMQQVEFDLTEPITPEMVLKSKKLLILRGREVVSTLEATMTEEVDHVRLDAEKRVALEAKFGIPEAKNSKIFATNGWRLVTSEEP